MRALILLPFVFAALLYLSNRMGVMGSIVERSGVDVQAKITHYANEWGLEMALVKAVAKVESNFNPMAKNPSDPSYGLMQITPALAYDYGLIRDYVSPSELEIEMIYNIDNNLSIACWFMSRLHSKYSFDEAVQMYNVGERGYKLGRRNPDYLNKVRGYYESYD
ncbi:transglycosylase SLT domain-containing protein [bacterium]|nr:transglycosylase SLT domain-containing protein [bacterium]